MKLRVYLSESSDVYYNIATEKYLFDTVKPDEMLVFLWSNDNTVVIGKNQNAFAEVNLGALTAGGGRLSRRFTGGGAVYHDVNNVNFTFTARNDIYDESRQASVILAAIESFGLRGEKNGRNDLTVDGRKFSGNAYLHAEEKGMHHGTLLISTDTERMSECLNVDAAKLAGKGVRSVKSRVVNLRELCPDMTRKALSEAVIEAAEKEYGAERELIRKEELDENAIKELAEFLASDEWLYGRSVKDAKTVKSRFDWGGAEVVFTLSDGRIEDAVIFTDSLIPDGLVPLENKLRGKNAEDLKKLDLSSQPEKDVIGMLVGALG
mgnify:FL=1